MTGAVPVSFRRHPGHAQFRAAPNATHAAHESRALWPDSSPRGEG